MYAKQAHKIAIKVAIQPILKCIQNAAKEGKFCTSFWKSECDSIIRKELERLGYKVELSPNLVTWVYWIEPKNTLL